eukprot:1095740-Pelagomonas_calceolata.AAC.1
MQQQKIAALGCQACSPYVLPQGIEKTSQSSARFTRLMRGLANPDHHGWIMVEYLYSVASEQYSRCGSCTVQCYELIFGARQNAATIPCTHNATDIIDLG